jgi:hypothetical protein
MSETIEKLTIRSANLQEGIDYEVACELVNMRISKKVAELVKAGTYDNPSEADMAELRALVASRP